MKRLTRLFLAGLACASAACAEVPSIVTNGFDAYKSSGSREALAIWLQGAPATANINTTGLPPDIGPGFEKPGAFGPMESYEVVASYSPTSRLRRIYAVAYFPQGPLFCCFDLYRLKGVWVTYGLSSNCPGAGVPDRADREVGLTGRRRGRVPVPGNPPRLGCVARRAGAARPLACRARSTLGWAMGIRVVRLGSPRIAGEGTRIGTVRLPPRGVPKSQFSARDWYDVWFPNLAPSLATMKLGVGGPVAGGVVGVRETVQGRDGRARRKARHRAPGGVVACRRLFGGLLLPRRGPLPRVRPEAAPYRGWGELDWAGPFPAPARASPEGRPGPCPGGPGCARHFRPPRSGPGSRSSARS